MKKALFLIVSLLSISCIACFAGCNQKGGGEAVQEKIQTRILTVEENENVEEKNDYICPDCEKRSMPKVHFNFKNGRPAGKNVENDGIDPSNERHHIKHPHPHPHRTPRPAPPEEGGQNKNKN